MSKVTFQRLFLACAAAALLALHAPAQLNRGAFTGTVTDSLDAVIPGAAVTIRNPATNATYKTGTTGVGQYTMANLPIGTYELAFEADGFKKLIRTGIELKATEVVRVDAVLEVGSLTESVRVTAEAPLLQSETPEVGVSLVSKDFMNLPLTFNNTRQPDDFAFKLSPGVSGTSYSSNILGSTVFSKETLLDGASITVYRSGDFSQMATSLEALAEFKVQTSGVSAEFGRTQGGVFNYIMKSGANELHGSAYGALRNKALNANTFPNKARGIARAQDRKQNFAQLRRAGLHPQNL